jgi:transposase InsO family protein
VDERMRFVLEQEGGLHTMTELCEIYHIARETGYYWLRRYRQGGLAALEDRNRAPQQHPNQTPEEIEEAVLELRRAHMSWGPRKLKRVLERREPERGWPATSTIGEMLAREGLVIARKKRRRAPPYTQPFASADAPNRVWCADFKGWFRTGDGERIDPLTITDACSRYLLRCQLVEKADTERVRAIFESAFRECGLPRAIRTDNGAPFASRAVAGLSRLAVWWMKLGIVPERIAAGHPEQNGRHERMHRTLGQETASPPAANRRAQQRAFDRFRREYNEERPHEALALETPSAVYTRSAHRTERRLFLEASARVCERNFNWRIDWLAADRRSIFYRLLRGLSDRAFRQPQTDDGAAAQRKRFLRAWGQGRGSFPFPGTSSPRSVK